MARKKGVRGKKVVKFESIKERLGPIKKEKMTKLVAIGEKKRREFVMEGRKNFSFIYALLIFFMVAFIGGVLIFMRPSVPVDTNPVKGGDIVKILYTGSLQNGSLFDSGNYTFVVGAGEVISGVEQAVIGMRIGEKKVVTVSPEQAYGYYDPNNALAVPLTQEINKTANTTEELFRLTFEEHPFVNRLYRVKGMEWSVRVIDIQNQTVVYRHEPEDGMVFDLKDTVGNVYGNSRVSVEGEKITITSSPVKGSVVTTVVGTGRVTEINETHMIMDFNHELAGETLIFEITLINFLSH